VQFYREKIVQCLILGKYTKAAPYTVETLLLYFAIEHNQCKDTQIGTWILLGMIVRIALRMGYHRDARHSARISPFHGEMRRRAWAVIFGLDIIVSSQIGLPRMIKERQSDTAELHNLLDSDFDEEVVNLPASRLDTDLTPMLYVVARTKMLSVFGKISDLTTSTQPSSYNDIMRLDKNLHEARIAIPQALQLRPMTRSITDSGDVVMQRIYLALLFHKAQCVLHRKYLIPAHSNNQYAYSRKSCIDAALQTLQHQSTLNQETRPGGQLYQHRWKVSSLINHDFLLATTILCLDLDRDMAAKSPRPSDNKKERSNSRSA
jgi:Fungal specific transcription factor domain